MISLPERTSRAVRVLIVDDSAFVRRVFSAALSKHPDIDVVGTATDPYMARERIVQLRPDVVTLDLEMPRMDGLTFLSKLMKHFPLPVVVVSSLSERNSATALRALAMGAVEVIGKPGGARTTGDVLEELANAVRIAAHARVAHPVTSGLHAPTFPATRPGHADGDGARKIIALGASTGGTQALELLLQSFPADAPGTVIVQHLPQSFTASFAKRLDEVSAVHVREAQDGDEIVPGLVLVAPGDKHLLVQASGSRLVARIKDGPMVHHQRPAVDVLFQSVARAAGRNAAAAILTGMGVDGAKGLLAMRDAGAYTVAQDEHTSVVYGMPREAANINAATVVLPLDQIAESLLNALQPSLVHR